MKIFRAVAYVVLASAMFVVFPSSSFGQKEAFPLRDVKPGITCTAPTVLRGQKPETIKLKTIGLTKNPIVGSGQIVLAEMQHGMPVVAGMSGSPVSCRGKLLGALSFSMGPFPLHKALAGITPIGDMLDQQQGLGKVPNAAKVTAALRGGDTLLDQITHIGNGEWPANNNFVFASLGGAAPLPAAGTPLGTLAPGDSVTVFFARGAVEMGGTCTTTKVTAQRFWLCGHPILGEGPIALPAYRSTVAKTFESSYNSFKIVGKTLEPVGTITYDNAFAVEGVREIQPNVMIPVHFKVTVDGNVFDYQFDVLRHPFYSSAVIESGTRMLLEHLWAETRLGTARLAAKIYLKGYEKPVEIYDAAPITKLRMQLGFLEGYGDPWAVLRNFQQKLASIQQSEFNFDIERVEISLDVWSGNRVLMLDSYSVIDDKGNPTEEIHPGETLTVILGMRNDNFSDMRIRKFTMTVPSDLHPLPPANGAATFLPARLVIMSGTKYHEFDPKLLPKGAPDSAEAFLKALRLDQHDPSEMFAVLLLPPEYQSQHQSTADAPAITSDAWQPVKSLDFLREQDSSTYRVVAVQLGAPLRDAVVSLIVPIDLKFVPK